MEIKYLGHSCFTIQTGGKTLLFDPFISGNELAKHIQLDSIQADYILVSHGHQDHTADLMHLALKTGATVISSWEICTWVQNQGHSKVHPMNVGGKRDFDFGKVSMTYAAHSSSFADGTYAGVAAGFVIESGGKTVYFSGDTGLTAEMKLIGERFRIDLSLLPVGDNFTMGAEDAAVAAGFLNCKNVIGIHYDTFGYIVIDHEKTYKTFQEKGIQLTLLSIGDTHTL